MEGQTRRASEGEKRYIKVIRTPFGEGLQRIDRAIYSNSGFLVRASEARMRISCTNQLLDECIPWDTIAMQVRITENYRDWIDNLAEKVARARIQVRVDRLVHGNPGKHRNLTGGVSELKIDVGPGYRVYYTQRGSELIVLLAGGNKSSQDRDIEIAIRLAAGL